MFQIFLVLYTHTHTFVCLYQFYVVCISITASNVKGVSHIDNIPPCIMRPSQKQTIQSVLLSTFLLINLFTISTSECFVLRWQHSDYLVAWIDSATIYCLDSSSVDISTVELNLIYRRQEKFIWILNYANSMAELHKEKFQMTQKIMKVCKFRSAHLWPTRTRWE